ncbi:MAG: RNA methyltransferase [Cellulophaga sp.]
MVVKSQIKFIKNLQQKKCRLEHGLFVVEGIKSVKELLNSHFKVYKIYATELNLVSSSIQEVELIAESDLKRMSNLKTPNKVLGVFHIPKPVEIDYSEWILALDDIRDPGNLGTIIRLCDWFGIQQLVCSPNTVDCYNSKVLQATMGSITRVQISYTNLVDFIKGSGSQVYGAFMDGNKVYNETFNFAGIMVMGNEANGISSEVEALITKKVTIPQFGKTTTESLNVATATAILLNELRRSE